MKLGLILDSAKEIYKAELILKVKEPIEPEYKLIPNQKLFCFFTLQRPKLAKVLIERKLQVLPMKLLQTIKQVSYLPLSELQPAFKACT